MRIVFFILISSVLVQKGIAQNIISVDSALSSAMRNYPGILQSQTEILQQQQLKKSSYEIPNPEFAIEIPDKEFTYSISQSIDFPLVYVNQSKLNNENILLFEQKLNFTKTEVLAAVRSSYMQLQFASAIVKELKVQDTLYQALSDANDKRYEKGEIGLLEKINANNAYQNKRNEFIQAQTEVQNAQRQLLLIAGLNSTQPPVTDTLSKLNVPSVISANTTYAATNPFIKYAQQNTNVALQNWKLQKSKLLPGFKGTYLISQNEPDITPSRLDLGITVPLWFWSYKGKIKAAKYNYDAANYQLAQTQLSVNAQWQQQISEFNKASASIQYYETSALPQSAIIIDAATRSYKAGEIGYVELLQSLNTAFQTKLGYLNALKNYNESIIQLLKISGQ